MGFDIFDLKTKNLLPACWLFFHGSYSGKMFQFTLAYANLSIATLSFSSSECIILNDFPHHYHPLKGFCAAPLCDVYF